MTLMKMIYKAYICNKMKRFFFATTAIVLLLSGCYKDDIWQLHSEVESLRDATIPSLSQQAGNVESSIANLNDLNAKLQLFIDQLEKSGISVSQSLTDAQKIISDFKKSSEENIDGTNAEFLAKINDLNEAVLTEIATIEALSAPLGPESESIQKKINELDEYLKNFAERDWVSGTYASLEVQNNIVDDLAYIKEIITSLNEASSELNSYLTNTVLSSIDGFKKDFDDEIKRVSEALKGEYTEAISTMSKTLAEANSAAILKAVEDGETEIKKWINEKLDDYYTIAQAEAQIKACNQILGVIPEGKSLQGEINDLKSWISSAKADVKEAYEKLIKDAIEEHEGKISAKMDSKIQELRATVIYPLAARLAPLEASVGKLLEDVTTLEAQIKTTEDQKAAISRSIAILTSLNMTLEEYVESVRAEFESNDKTNFNELKALIDALESLITGSGDGSLPSQIEALTDYIGTLPEGATDITSWISATLGTLENQFKTISKISEVDEIFKAIRASLDTDETAIKTLEANIANLLIDNEEKIKGWISAKLDGYYTTGEIEGLLEAMKTELSSLFAEGDQELQGKITALETKINEMKSTLTTGYEKAISEAIETEKGKVTDRIKKEINPIVEQVGKLKEESDNLKGQVVELRQELDGYNETVATLERNLLELQNFLKIYGYTSLKDIVDDLLGKFAALADTYQSQAEFEEMYEYVAGHLTNEVKKIQGLVDRLKAVQDKLDVIDKFVDGFDSTVSLHAQIEAIKDDIQKLKDAVNGKDGKPSLQEQIDIIMVALYGENKDPEHPSEDSIVGTLDSLEAKIEADAISTISYVPRFLDQTEAIYKNGEGKISAQFRFIVSPASAATLLNKDNVKMKYSSYSSTMVPYSSQVVEIDGDLISIFVTEEADRILDGDGNPKVSSALFYEPNSSGPASFVSKFIFFQKDDTDTGAIEVDGSKNITVPKEGGTFQITVGAENNLVENRSAYWLVRTLNNLGRQGAVINILNYGSVYADWVTVNPLSNYTPESRWNYPFIPCYVGKVGLTITVAPNDTGAKRSTSLIFRQIYSALSGLSNYSDEDLVIQIEQAG